MKKTKKWMTAIVAALMVMTMAATAAGEEAAEAKARAIVGESARLKEWDLDDGYYEYEYIDGSVSYEVLVDAWSGEVSRIEKRDESVRKAGEGTLTQAEAEAAAEEASAGGTVEYALLERDDGQYEWKVFVRKGSEVSLYTVQAQSGAIYGVETYPQGEGVMSAEEAVAALKAAQGDVEVTELDLELNDNTHTLRYEGKAQSDGRRYEFEMDAADGKLYEWERD